VQGAFLPIPPILGGAVEKIQCGLSRELAKRGYSVTHISRNYKGLAADETIDGVRYIRASGYDTPKSLVVLKLLDLLYSLQVLKHLPRADIVVTNTFWLPILLRSRAKGAVYVNVNRYPKGQMRYYGKAARLQAVSQAVADAIIEQSPGVRDIVKVVPNQLPEGWSKPAPNLESERKLQILYVGRVHPEKGTHLLLEAFARVLSSGNRSWQLVIVGPVDAAAGGGGAEYDRQLRLMSAAYSSYIDWVGPVYESERLKGYYDMASFFVYPSLATFGEAFGLSPLEAMARACPPIVSDLACFRDFLKPGENGLSFDHTWDGATNLAAAMSRLMSEEDLLGRMREACLDTAQEYSLERVTDLFEKDFAEITNNSKI
jgi:glycosyltransferase involved in cell wall biosynthesis